MRSLVGRVSMKGAQGWMRKTMLGHALDASHGSRRAAAQLLGVTRPALQRMLREQDCGRLAQVQDSSRSLCAAVSRSMLRPIPNIMSTAASRAKARRRRSF